MGGFDPVRDSASASPLGAPRFDPVRDSVAPTPSPHQESRQPVYSHPVVQAQGRFAHSGQFEDEVYEGRYAKPQMGYHDEHGELPSMMEGEQRRFSVGHASGTERRRPSRSASIADILNDDDVQAGNSSSGMGRFGQSYAHHPDARYHLPPSPGSYGHPGYPVHPDASMSSPHFAPGVHPSHGPSPSGHYPHYSPEDAMQMRASPTAHFAAPRLSISSSRSIQPSSSGSKMPTSPMRESPRSRLPEMIFHHEAQPHQAYSAAPAHTQHSPTTAFQQAHQVPYSITRNSSSGSIASGDHHSSIASPQHPTGRIERSPSLQNLLNDRIDERRRPSSRSSTDTSRAMGPPMPPATPSAAQSHRQADSAAARSSPMPEAVDSKASSDKNLLSADDESKSTSRAETPETATSSESRAPHRKTSSKSTTSTGRKKKMSKAQEEDQAKAAEGLASLRHGSVDESLGAATPRDYKENFEQPRHLDPVAQIRKDAYSEPAAADIEGETDMKSEASIPAVEKVETRRPYKPTQRVSVPTTLRLPITAAEADRMHASCRNPLRRAWQEENGSLLDGWHLVRAELERAEQSTRVESNGTDSNTTSKKRKKPPKSSSEEREFEKPSQATHDANASLVAAHYNARQDVGLGARKQSPILPLRNFNNWIKSSLIAQYVRRGGRALDLGGGKGGDLPKWAKGGVRELVLADIADVSVAQARDRYLERGYNFKADFYALDCFGKQLASHIPREILAPMFDIVSLQFCLHYGWENVSKAQLMLENVARYLKPGGTFVGTIPDCDYLRARLMHARQEQPSSTAFGNSFYRVVFDNDEGNIGGTDIGQPRFPLFGQRYTFSLLDAVDNVAEYVVDWDQLESLAAQNGMQCIYKKTFADMWHEERQANRHRDVARRMGISLDREVPMEAELWEACCLYVAFAFEKTTGR